MAMTRARRAWRRLGRLQANPLVRQHPRHPVEQQAAGGGGPQVVGVGDHETGVNQFRKAGEGEGQKFRPAHAFVGAKAHQQALFRPGAGSQELAHRHAVTSLAHVLYIARDGPRRFGGDALVVESEAAVGGGADAEIILTAPVDQIVAGAGGVASGVI
jgi:hypothetical protein